MTSDAALFALLAPETKAPAGAPGRAAVSLGDRYRGVLLGVAAGNTLGLPVEGWSRESIERTFPGGVRDVPALSARRPWDDDLAQTAILAEALLEGDSLDEENLGRKLVQWLFEGGNGIGLLTLEVLGEIRAGVAPKEAARRAWERSGRNAAGNGAVMRCSPVALRWRRAPRRLVDETRESAAVTHHDERCGWSAVAVNAALARSLEGCATDLGELAFALDSAGAPRAVSEAVRLTEGRPLADLRLGDPGAMGYTLKAMQAGLWCLAQPEDFEAVLVQVVNAGGDTDTNGAVAGAVMGARVGEAGIPRRWLASIARADRLVELADGLLDRSGADPHPEPRRIS